MDSNALPIWLIALPVIAVVAVLIAPNVSIVARNLRRAGSAGVVGGISSAVVAVAASHPDTSMVPAAIAAGLASTAAAGYLSHPERAWFGKRLSGARFKRTDVVRGKRSKGVRTSFGGRPKVKSSAARIRPNR